MAGWITEQHRGARDGTFGPQIPVHGKEAARFAPRPHAGLYQRAEVCVFDFPKPGQTAELIGNEEVRKDGKKTFLTAFNASKIVEEARYHEANQSPPGHVADHSFDTHFDHPQSSLKIIDRVDQAPEPAEIVSVKVHNEPRQVDDIGILLFSRERPGRRNVALGQQDVLKRFLQDPNVVRTER